MKRPVQNARGAILIMAAIIMVVLIGVAALALDLGRLFVLHTEMQNAVDAAAISAAAELDGETDAFVRAKTAANQEMLNHLSHFSKKNELLENLETEDLIFTFYSWIGSEYDGEDPPTSCTPNAENKCETIDFANASYVRITLDPDPALFSSDDGRYEIDLYFLPVLSLFTNDPVAATASTRVAALAGSHYEACNYPPMMICDPDEGGDPLSPGDMVDLKEQKDSSKLWGPGFFGWLIPSKENSDDPGDGGLSGNRLLARRLGSKYGQRCDPPIVEPNPGNKGNWPRWALNTRFGLYQHGFFRGSNKSDYPSAPNIIDYPRDDKIHPVQQPLGNRFGNGEWIVTEVGYEDRPSVFSRTDYNTHFNPGAAALTMITRLQYYNWEMAGNLAVNNFPGPLHAEETQCDEFGSHTQECRMLNGLPFPGAAQDPDNEFKRRELFVAMVPCVTNGIKGGTKPFNLDDAGGKWAKFLMTEHIPPPSAGEGIKVVAEFIDYVEQRDDEHFKTVIQLYE